MDGKRLVYMQGVHGTLLDPIIIENDAGTVHLQHCSFIEVRNNSLTGGAQGIRIFSCSDIVVRNNTISDNLDEGIFLFGTDCSIIGNTIERNFNGIYIIADGRIPSTGITLWENTIRDNVDFGLRSSHNSDGVDARWNWWGMETGPGGKGPGGGDWVSDYIVYEPWLGKQESRKPVTEKEEDPSIVPYLLLGMGIFGISGCAGLAFLREDLRFALMTLMLLPLYSRLDKDEILAHEKRNILYQYILTHPGVHYSTLRREMSYGNGTLVHHLTTLERTGMVRRRKEYGRIHYFPARSFGNTAVPPIERPLSVNQRTIIEFLKSKEWATSREIQVGCSLSRSSVDYSLAQLVKDGTVKRITDEEGSRVGRYQVRKV